MGFTAGGVTENIVVQEQVKVTAATVTAKPGKRPHSKISDAFLYRLAVLVPLGGLACAVLFSLTAWSASSNGALNPYGWKPFVHALVVFILISGASFFSGGLLGFLFGFPRTPDTPHNTSAILRYQHNKNLEQISDWLIKMLIGIGLSQMNNFPGLIWYYASRLTVGITTIGSPTNGNAFTASRYKSKNRF